MELLSKLDECNNMLGLNFLNLKEKIGSDLTTMSIFSEWMPDSHALVVREANKILSLIQLKESIYLKAEQIVLASKNVKNPTIVLDYISGKSTLPLNPSDLEVLNQILLNFN